MIGLGIEWGFELIKGISFQLLINYNGYLNTIKQIDRHGTMVHDHIQSIGEV